MIFCQRTSAGLRAQFAILPTEVSVPDVFRSWSVLLLLKQNFMKPWISMAACIAQQHPTSVNAWVDFVKLVADCLVSASAFNRSKVVLRCLSGVLYLKYDMEGHGFCGLVLKASGLYGFSGATGEEG